MRFIGRGSQFAKQIHLLIVLPISNYQLPIENPSIAFSWQSEIGNWQSLDPPFAGSYIRSMESPHAQQKNRFVELFGEGGKLRVIRAPGRVNLIGEHTDYNDGFVLPAAIESAAYVAAAPRHDRTINAASL